MKEKIKAFIEMGEDKTYNVYIDTVNNLNYNIFGEGDTPEEAINDFINSYEELINFHVEKNLKFIKAEFDFFYDVASFLKYYSQFISLVGLSKLTGINRKQLSHYLNGTRNPSPKTVIKIEDGIKKIADELNQVNFA